MCQLPETKRFISHSIEIPGGQKYYDILKHRINSTDIGKVSQFAWDWKLIFCHCISTLRSLSMLLANKSVAKLVFGASSNSNIEQFCAVNNDEMTMLFDLLRCWKVFFYSNGKIELARRGWEYRISIKLDFFCTAGQIAKASSQNKWLRRVIKLFSETIWRRILYAENQWKYSEKKCCAHMRIKKMKNGRKSH